MRLSREYYEALFHDGIRLYESGWQLEESCWHGVRWERKLRPFREEFRIARAETGTAVLQFAVYVPELVAEAGIVGECAAAACAREVTVEIGSGAVRLAVSVSAWGGRESVLAFIREARGAVAEAMERALKRTGRGARAAEFAERHSGNTSSMQPLALEETLCPVRPPLRRLAIKSPSCC